MNVLARIRVACAAVSGQARSVRIDEERLGALAAELASAPPAAPAPDPAHHRWEDPDTTLAFAVTLGAINFGSGWFPHLAKRPGRSGYFTVATALEEHFARAGPWSAAQLEALCAGDCAAVLGQDLGVPEVAELMELFARSLRDLGRFLGERHAGRFAGLVAEARRSAARLVAILAGMPLYRDVARYGALEVPFYKRAQLTAADLANAFEGHGPGRFDDLDALTAFADNLVPHVLRWEGVLAYAPALAQRIDAGELIPAGSPEEVEIRAAAVHAVEGCVERLRRAGIPLSAQRIDSILWNRGQRPEFKAHPRHRTRSVFY